MIAQIDKKYIKTRPRKLYSRLVSYFFFEGRPITTKGQWINKFLFIFFNLFKALPKLKKVDRPILILGTGRSGTTILGIVLSMHRQIGFLNEPKALWHSAYKKEDIIGSYSRLEANYRLDKTHATAEITKNINHLYSAYSRFSLTKRIVDKYPELVFRLPFVFAILPESKGLFLARNGWDTIASIEHWSDRLGKQKNGEIHDWWGVNNRKWLLLKEQILKTDEYFEPIWAQIDGITSHTEFAALEWVATMREGIKAIEKYPNKILRINYEDLTNNTEAILNQIITFTELKNDSVFIEYAKSVLSSSTPKDKARINPIIANFVEETMSTLGYK